MPRKLPNPSRAGRFKGSGEYARGLQTFADGLRAALGLCPLYGPDAPTDYRLESPEPSSPRRPMRIGIAGMSDVRPHEPTTPCDMASAIDRQIRRDKYYAKTRVTITERQKANGNQEEKNRSQALTQTRSGETEG